MPQQTYIEHELQPYGRHSTLEVLSSPTEQPRLPTEELYVIVPGTDGRAVLVRGKPPRLRPAIKMLFIAIVVILVIGVTVGGAVGGDLAARRSSRQTTANDESDGERTETSFGDTGWKSTAESVIESTATNSASEMGPRLSISTRTPDFTTSTTPSLTSFVTSTQAPTALTVPNASSSTFPSTSFFTLEIDQPSLALTNTYSSFAGPLLLQPYILDSTSPLQARQLWQLSALSTTHPDANLANTTLYVITARDPGPSVVLVLNEDDFASAQNGSPEIGLVMSSDSTSTDPGRLWFFDPAQPEGGEERVRVYNLKTGRKWWLVAEVSGAGRERVFMSSEVGEWLREPWKIVRRGQKGEGGG